MRHMTGDNKSHVLYKNGEPDVPDCIKDRNGEVVLGLCRRCGAGEIELSGPCYMTNFVEDIKDFHKKFGLEYSAGPRQLPTDLQDFRSKFLQEELDEYEEGVVYKDKEKQLDSLVDLLYVAFGTAYLHGFDIQAAWNRVHNANMQKIRAERPEDSRRGSIKYDVVKPPGWKAPDLSDLV